MDNHHVTILNSSMSCGVIELSHITADLDKVMFAIANYLYHPAKGSPVAFILWSDVFELSNGYNLYIDLVDNCSRFAASLQRSEQVINPKTGNMIFVCIWEISHEAFKKWYIEQRVERAKRL